MRRTLRICVTVGCAALLAAVVAKGQAMKTAEDVASAQQAALLQGGLRAAAAVTGSYAVVLNNSDEAGPTSLEALVRGSKTILVGRVLSNYSALAPGGPFIRTEYRVRVEELLMGDASRKDRDTVIISMLGGRVSFPDGSHAQQTVRNVNVPLDGRKYLFFLIGIPDVSKAGPSAIEVPAADFWPLRGSYGVFELPEDGSGVRPGHMKPRGQTPSRDYNGVYPESMLLDVRREIKEFKNSRR
jgi:hypothetical protein